MLYWIGAAMAGGGLVLANETDATYESPWGPISHRTREGLCKAPVVRIGTVASVNTYIKTMHNMDGVPVARMVFSGLVLNSERNIRGNAVSQFSTDVHGGVIADVQYPTSRHEPQPVIGARYLMAMGIHHDPTGQTDWPDGQLLHAAVATLDATVPLPSESTLRDELEAWCE